MRVENCTAAVVGMLTREIFARQLEPAALVATRSDGTYVFYALFEGFARGVEEQAERFQRLAYDLGPIAGALEHPQIAGMRDEAIRTRGDVRIRLAAPPASLERLDGEALDPLTSALDEAQAVLYPSLGVAFVSGYLGDVERAAAAVARARAAAETLGGNAVLIDARDAAFAERVDVYGTLPGSFALMRRLKERFDPHYRLNPGRFLGGL